MREFDEEEYFEISGDDESTADDLLVPIERVKKRRRRYTTGSVEKKNEPKMKAQLDPKLLIIRRTIICVGGALLIGFFLLGFALPLLNAWEGNKKRAAVKKPTFFFTSTDALKTVDSFLAEDEKEALKTHCASSSTLGQALDSYLDITKDDKPVLMSGQKPALVEDHFPNYFPFETEHQLSPIYVIEEDERHLIDLEATIGYNEISIDDLNTFSLKQASNVRLILKSLSAEKGDVYWRMEGEFPQNKGRLILYCQKDTQLAKTIEYKLRNEQVLRATVDLSLYDIHEPKKYFISSLKSFSWIVKK